MAKTSIEYRKALKRAVRLYITELRDGCVDCIETFEQGKGLSCQKHKREICKVIDSPLEHLPPGLKPKQ